MESKATLKFARVSARKARLVADLVRGRDASDALAVLAYLPKKTAPLIRKLVESAVANAEQAARNANSSLDVDALYVTHAIVNEGPKLKRFTPAAMGRATPVHKRTSHIDIIVSEKEGR